MRSSIRLAKDEALHLALFLGRVIGWDERAAARIVTRGGVVGIYAPLPMDVLALIVLPLAASAEATEGETPEIDATVSAGRMRDIIADVSRLAPVTDLVIPDSVTGSPSLALLPPQSRWLPGERGMAGDLAPMVDSAVAAFRAHVPVSGSLHATLLAESAWDAPGWGGLPMRALHAARLLCFISHPGARIESGTVSGWKRLVTPGGQVFVRTQSGARLSLVPTPR